MSRLAVLCSLVLVVAMPQAPRFKSRVDLVRVEVLALAGSMPISGLSLSDFEIRDNGVVQPLTAFYREDQPLDVLLVLDTSGSVVGEPLESLKRAAKGLVGQLKEGDRAALLTFGNTHALRVGFTADKSALGGAIDRIAADGGTALLDALYCGITVAAGSDRRHLIVVFTDGIDNRSWLSQADLLAALRESDAVISAVALEAPASRTKGYAFGVAQDLALFEEVTRQSGGEIVMVKRSTDLEGAFTDVLGRMRARYLVTYYPVGVERAGWHALSVRLKGRPGTVVARRGYYAGVGSRRTP